MNVEGSNLLSMLSNSNDLEGLQQAILRPDIVGTEFSEALMQQITLLRQPAEATEIIDTQALPELAETVPVIAHQQELAVSEGTNLPPAEGLGGEIDLERTIDVLQDVMQHIADVTAFIENASATVSDAIEHVMTHLETDLSATAPAAPVAQIVDASLPVIEELGEMRSALNIEDPAEIPRQISEQDINALLNEEIKQPLMQKQVAQEFEKQGLHAGLAMKKAADNLETQDVDLSVDDDNALSDLLKRDNAIQKAEIDNPVLAAKQAEKSLQEFDVSDKESILHKTLPRLAAEMGQFNRPLNSPDKVEIPGMNKAFNHPEWQQEFGEKILWMHSKSVQVAELRLNPQHLGPVSIRVDVSQDQATLAFTVQHSAVREAIEAAMPRLRDMLQGQQLNLADVNVSQDHSAEQRHSQNFAQNNNAQQDQSDQSLLAANETEDSVASITDEIEHSRSMVSNGLLNIFA